VEQARRRMQKPQRRFAGFAVAFRREPWGRFFCPRNAGSEACSRGPEQFHSAVHASAGFPISPAPGIRRGVRRSRTCAFRRSGRRSASSPWRMPRRVRDHCSVSGCNRGSSQRNRRRWLCAITQHPIRSGQGVWMCRRGR
jgi:hypothetical protein